MPLTEPGRASGRAARLPTAPTPLSGPPHDSRPRARPVRVPPPGAPGDPASAPGAHPRPGWKESEPHHHRARPVVDQPSRPDEPSGAPCAPRRLWTRWASDVAMAARIPLASRGASTFGRGRAPTLRDGLPSKGWSLKKNKCP